MVAGQAASELGQEGFSRQHVLLGKGRCQLGEKRAQLSVLGEHPRHGARHSLGHPQHGGKEQRLLGDHVTAESLLERGEMPLHLGQRADTQKVLHLGQQVTQVFGMDALLAAAPVAALHPFARRQRQRGLVDHRGDRRLPWLAQPARVGADARFGQRQLDQVDGEHFPGIRPQVVQRPLHPPV